MGNGTEKLLEVTRLLELLKTDLEQKDLKPASKLLSPLPPLRRSVVNEFPERIETLQKLRVHGRKTDNAEPIYEKEVRTLR